jgi:hypothetical protein
MKILQRKATKLVPSLQDNHKPYQVMHELLKLTTFHTRRPVGDLTNTLKIFKGFRIFTHIIKQFSNNREFVKTI